MYTERVKMQQIAQCVHIKIFHECSMEDNIQVIFMTIMQKRCCNLELNKNRNTEFPDGWLQNSK